jgi:hypothetical protein
MREWRIMDRRYVTLKATDTRVSGEDVPTEGSQRVARDRRPAC